MIGLLVFHSVSVPKIDVWKTGGLYSSPTPISPDMHQYGDNLYLTTTRHPSTTVANNYDAVNHPADIQNQSTGSDGNDQGFPTRQNSIVNDTINDSTYQIGDIYDLSYCIDDDKVTPYSGGGDDVSNIVRTGMNGDRDFAVTAAPLNRSDSISSNSHVLSNDISRTWHTTSIASYILSETTSAISPGPKKTRTHCVSQWIGARMGTWSGALDIVPDFDANESDVHGKPSYDHAQASWEDSSATSILVLCNPKQPSANAGPRSAKARPFSPGVMSQEGGQGRHNQSRPNTKPNATELSIAWPPLTVSTTMLCDFCPASSNFSTTRQVNAKGFHLGAL